MLDVKFYEVFEEEKEALQKCLAKNVEAAYTPQTVQECGDTGLPARLISVRTQSTIPNEWAQGLEGILTRSSGFDHLVRYCRQADSKAVCGYLAEYCSRAVAEQAVLTMLMLMRKVKRQTAQLDTFNREGLTGTECLEKNLLVYGVGNIGTEIVKIAQALGMNVKGVDIEPKLKGLEHVSLEDGLPWADAVICSAPLTEKTGGIFKYDTFKKARSGLFFINISRGEISPAEDLKRLLLEGRLSGLGLDTYPEEDTFAAYLKGNLKEQSAAWKALLEIKGRDDVVFTPHNAFNTKESVERKAKQSAAAIEQFLKQKSFPNTLST